MDVEKLKEALRSWMKVETWHTNHPLDDERFHKALKNAFSELGTNIDGGSFEKVIRELADEYHPNWDQSYKDEAVNEFAIRAEHIASYLYDAKRI
jgi:hypothetical protein